jgi:hypothetical protein
MKAPFPWFGGKSTIAPAVWERFGDVRGYIEPFFGSGAMLLNRPEPFGGVETVNDADGLVCNFWRAVKAAPADVARWADWPVNENDLHARHSWLVGVKDALGPRLDGDPEYFDAKIAGWWVWGMACWIGSGFCSGNGPWSVVDGQLVHLGAGRGVNRKRVHLGNAGQGVNRKRVHLSDAGRGVNRQLVHLSDAGDAGDGECGLVAWMEALAARFERVRVCCGDWRRVCGGNSGDSLHHFFSAGSPAGIFLDPPYSSEASRCDDLYRVEDLSIAHDVREWAIAHGDDRRLRIALCGYDGEHAMPDDWEALPWKAKGGYGNVADDEESTGKVNAHREMVWFSPHCLHPTKTLPLFQEAQALTTNHGAISRCVTDCPEERKG